ncbi:hypothetical protein Cgig2_003751 [Carnegiea gigantea]|uniref:3-oxo-5-alpha-steroid 4-dehydrogenase C-terminal domain-containing protein n=1 Tax=Carnegiea gigantea TaxID=171969 RepID=A0A9Q1K8G4_9CARY|nr:hypothetical protein Cgig2_003751 [Carnegiea gigantea]
MESPTVVFSLLIYSLGQFALSLQSLSLLSCIHRTCIYPLCLRRRITTTSSSFPISVAAMAFAFNLLNLYVQLRWISHYADYSAEGRWFWWRLAAGMVMFLAGMAVNVTSDLTLNGGDNSRSATSFRNWGTNEKSCGPESNEGMAVKGIVGADYREGSSHCAIVASDLGSGGQNMEDSQRNRGGEQIRGSG